MMTDQVSSSSLSSSSSLPCLVLHAETRAAIEDITVAEASTKSVAVTAAAVSTADTIIVAPVEIILNKEHMYIGRGSIKLPVDILLIARKGERDVISRRHAEITIHDKIIIAGDDEINNDEINHRFDQQYILHDLKSINGVFVNDIKIDSVVLSDGDVIQFGGVSNMDYGSKLKSCDTCIKYVFKQKKRMTTTMKTTKKMINAMNVIPQQQEQKSIVVGGDQHEVDGDDNTKNKFSKASNNDILERNGTVKDHDRVNKHQDGIKHDINCRINPPISSSSSCSSGRMDIQEYDNNTTILKRNEIDTSKPTDNGDVLKSMAVKSSTDSISTLKRKHSDMINDDNNTISHIDDYEVKADNNNNNNNNKSENKHSTSVITADVTKNNDNNFCIINNIKDDINTIRDDGMKANNSSTADVNYESFLKANVKERESMKSIRERNENMKNHSVRSATSNVIVHTLPPPPLPPPTTTTTTTTSSSSSSSTTTSTTTTTFSTISTTSTASNFKTTYDNKTTINRNDKNPHHPIKTIELIASVTKGNKQIIQNNNKRTQLPNDNNISSSSSSSSSSSTVITEQDYTKNLRNLKNNHTLTLCNLIKTHRSNEKRSREQIDILLKEHQVEKTQLLNLISQYKSELLDYKQRQDQNQEKQNLMLESAEEQQQQDKQQQHASILYNVTNKSKIIEDFKMKINSFEVMINKSNEAKELSNQLWQAKYDNDMESLRLTMNDQFQIEKNNLLTTCQIKCQELEQKLKDTNNNEDRNDNNNINKSKTTTVNATTTNSTTTTSSSSSQKDHPTKTSIVDNNNIDDENRMLNTITTIEANLICFLCSELLLDAVVLSCSHGFCRACIESHWNKSKKKIDKTVLKLLCCYCPKCNMNVSIRTNSSNSVNRNNNIINKSNNGEKSRMVDNSVNNYFRSDHLDNLVGIIVDTFPDSLKTSFSIRENNHRKLFISLGIDPDKSIVNDNNEDIDINDGLCVDGLINVSVVVDDNSMNNSRNDNHSDNHITNDTSTTPARAGDTKISTTATNNNALKSSIVDKSCEYCGNTEHDGDDCPHQMMIDDDDDDDDDDDEEDNVDSSELHSITDSL